jgi:hypothetical protein
MGLELTKAIGPIAGMIGGPVLANLFAPEGQELSSFEGRGAIDPVNMLSNVNSLIGRIGGAVTDRASQPVSLPSSYVQQPPVFTGGGMPMPIGVSGQDPALADPSLLSLQGLDQFKGIFDGLTAQPYDPNNPNPNPVTPDGGYQSDPYTPEGDRSAVPKAGASGVEPATTRRKPAQLVRGADLLAEDEGQVDDMDRAVASIKLLMQNM